MAGKMILASVFPLHDLGRMNVYWVPLGYPAFLVVAVLLALREPLGCLQHLERDLPFSDSVSLGPDLPCCQSSDCQG